MKKRSGFFVYALCCWLPVAAQPLDTTVQLAPVRVAAAMPPVQRQPALFTYKPDSLLMRALPAGSVADWLQWQGTVSVRSYGSAGLATVSVRGSGSQQNAVLWDGLSLLSPLNSTPDFNLLPLWLFSDVQLQTGSSSADFGSGAVGGALHLGQSVPQHSSLSAFVETRSFGDRSTGLAYAHRSKKWWYSARALYRQADNDFSYLNTAKFGAPEEQLGHAATRMGGFLQEVGWQPHAKHRLKLRWWYQAYDRQLPPSMTEALSTANQADSANRLFLSWDYQGEKRSFSFKSAYLSELNQYVDARINLNERHRFKALLQEFRLQQPLSGNQQGSLLVQQAYYWATSPNYDLGVQQHRLALVPGWRIQRPRFNTQFRVRSEWVDGRFVPLTPSLQHEQRLPRGYEIHAAVARNYRLPTLNDLYWRPGGNVELQPELGWSSEIALHKKLQVQGHTFALRSGGFFTEVDNWIIWLPNASFGFWSPRNLRRVRSWGFEQQLNWSKTAGKMQLRATADYAYVHTTNQQVSVGETAIRGKQLIYVPRHQLRGRAFVQYQQHFIGWQFGYSGLRYTSTDNSAFLPGYEQSSLLLGSDFAFKKHTLRFNVGIHNLFNTEFQAVAWRPMPGRHFHLNITYHLNKL